MEFTCLHLPCMPTAYEQQSTSLCFHKYSDCRIGELLNSADFTNPQKLFSKLYFLKQCIIKKVLHNSFCLHHHEDRAKCILLFLFFIIGKVRVLLVVNHKYWHFVRIRENIEQKKLVIYKTAHVYMWLQTQKFFFQLKIWV